VKDNMEKRKMKGEGSTRCQDQQVQNQAGWLRIDGVEVDTIREATVGVLEIPKG